ncbi:FkbM family methyltransferase [Gammaproteobacteria bacterium]|nr:FkbM family methyltransferase [Gammaproteobacteria bacterium]
MRFFQKYLHMILPSFLVKFIRSIKNSFNINYIGYVALNNLDKQLEAYCNHQDGYYVELGANDGITQSNSFYFEKKKNWKGVLIEPSPNNYLKCRQNRDPSNKFFCNACVSFDFKEEYVEMIYANLMTVSHNLEKDIDSESSFLKRSLKYLDKYEDHFTFGAKAKTLTDLLIEADSPNIIDFLSLDVEGSEMEVLKGLDFKKFHFHFLLIESRSIDILKNFLLRHGYVLEKKFSQHDFLFKNNNLSFTK